MIFVVVCNCCDCIALVLHVRGHSQALCCLFQESEMIHQSTAQAYEILCVLYGKVAKSKFLDQTWCAEFKIPCFHFFSKHLF